MSLGLTFSLVAVVCYASLVVVAIRRGLRIRVNQFFALYLGTMFAWQVAYILLCLSPTDALASFWYRIVIALASGQAIFFFLFARALVHPQNPRWLALLGFLVWLITVFALATDPGHLIIRDIAYDEVARLYVPDFGPLIVVIGAPNFAFMGYGLAALVSGYRKATSELEHNRLRYLLLAVVISLLGALANFVPSLRAYPVDVTANIISALLLSYAILRYQLLDITLVVRRGLAYSSLTAAIALVYVLSILLFERLVRAMVGFGAFLVPIVMAMLAAILLQPWRDKAQAWVDRLLFREQYDAQRMLQELSRQTTTIIDLEILGNLVLGEICQTMRLEGAALFLKEGGGEGFVAAAQRGLDPQASMLRLGPDHPVVQWLLHTERPLHIHELDMLPQFRGLWSEEKEQLTHLGAQLFIPLQVKNALVGILVVGARLSGEAYSGVDKLTLSTLANQTAVAVENALLLATTRARVAELTALQDVGVRLVSARRLPTVLQVVAESGARLLGANEAHVALYDPARDCFTATRSLAADGSDRSLSWTSAAAVPLRLAARGGQPVIISDLRLHTAIPPALARESSARAVAAYLLRRSETIIGVLAVIYYQPHTFTEEELRLLGMLSGQATLAIDNAQLLESEQSKRQLADTLREVSRVIGSTLQLDVLLDLVLEQLQNVVDYDGAAVMLLSGGALEVSTVRGPSTAPHFVGKSFALKEHSILGEMIRGRTPIISGDILQDSRWADVQEGMQVRAFIGVPLVVRDQPRGILAMGRSTPISYSPDDLRNVVAFANQATLAFENARLYQETIAEKRKTDTILKETLSGIVVTDVDLHIVTFNSGAEAITGLAAEQVIGRHLPDVLGPGIAAPASPLGQVMAGAQRVPPQETVVQAAPGLRDFLQGAVALHDANRTLFGYLLSFADITRLKEVDRLKTDIVANVSHELRTPLASIKAYTELLLDNVEGEDRQLRDQFLGIIDQETDHLSQLISDLLDLSRLEAGRFEVRKTTLDLGELLSKVLALLDMQRRSREVTIHVSMPDDLPVFSADGDMVTIILRNLLTNAIKFSHRGGEVLVALENSPDWLVLRVTDNGIGIPAEAMPHLFQKFYRVQAATELGIEGTGLGLVLTKQAVEAHGGAIELESEPGVGSTFTVRLPWQ